MGKSLRDIGVDTQVGDMNKYLDVFEAERKIEVVRQERGVFYKINP